MAGAFRRAHGDRLSARRDIELGSELFDLRLASRIWVDGPFAFSLRGIT